uniref:Uncharacterized protein n=1 Tax=Salvator merianae TaxID=96440 RepID=A0A8D0E6C5_SALMN
MNKKGCVLYGYVLMLCFTDALGQDCSQLHRWLNKDNLKFLNSRMGPTIPSQCINDVMDFTNNEEICISETQKENAKIAVQGILQETAYLFQQNHTALSWDESSIDAFQQGLHQASDNLGKCLSRERKLIQNPSVNRYFREIRDFLSSKAYSLCAWEIVQMEIRHCFLLIDQNSLNLNTK